ncbi:MAG: NAD-dependent dehydratase, partial [Flavisolibacter sp.]|nr:NAD-dependent dehydratase [Flavisolibacter sp.]
GHSVRYIASDERTTGDIAKVLGTAIGKPDLPWVAFSDEQTLGGMQQAGLPEEVARNYTEMGAAIRSGIFSEDYWANRPRLSKTKLEDFAPAFAAAYNAS